MKYLNGDRVKYVGTKYNDIKSSVGYVIAPIWNEEGKYVIDFGTDSFVMSETNIAPYRPSPNKEDGFPEVIPIRRRKTEDD